MPILTASIFFFFLVWGGGRLGERERERERGGGGGGGGGGGDSTRILRCTFTISNLTHYDSTLAF